LRRFGKEWENQKVHDKHGGSLLSTLRVGLLVAVLAIALSGIAFAVYAVSPNWNLDFGLYFLVGSVFSTINMVLSLILLITYLGTYSKTKAEFNLVLVIVALTLLSYSVVANPLIRTALGYGGSGLGPFLMLPDMFIFVALVALLYLRIKY
jgi:ABC-type amino acid transport system permease subunit